MDREAFRQFKEFAFNDVRREISLARVSESEDGLAALQDLGVKPGGGNFMAALALLCYTEFAGKLKFDGCKASDNFNRIFDELGDNYKKFRASGNNVYDIFRCGLVHQYYVKKTCTIAMFGRADRPGIGKCSDGRYYFVVERYCRDLERVFDALETHLFPPVQPR